MQLHSIGSSLRLGLASLLLLISGIAQAVPIVNYSGGIATGVSGLDVGGSSYDVTFAFGSYDSVFGGGSATFLGNEAGAQIAANALVAALNDEASLPRVGNGSRLGVVWTVFETSAGLFRSTQAGYQSPDWQRFGNFLGVRGVDHSSLNWGFAVYKPAVGVAEPETLVLLGIALIGLVAVKRKQLLRVAN